MSKVTPYLMMAPLVIIFALIIGLFCSPNSFAEWFAISGFLLLLFGSIVLFLNGVNLL